MGRQPVSHEFLRAIALSEGARGTPAAYDRPVEPDGPDGPDSLLDSPWRPDADVRFEHPPMRPFDRADGASGETPADDSHVADRAAGPIAAGSHETDRRLHLGVAGGLLVGLLAIGSVVWATGAATSPDAVGLMVPTISDAATPVDTAVSVVNDGLPLGAAALNPCGGARLPTELDFAWSAGLPGVRSVRSDMAISEQSVVAIVGLAAPDAAPSDPAELIALELATGAIRWRSGLGPGGSSQQVLGVVDGVVIVEQKAPDRSFTGFVAFDEADGSELWSLQSPAPSQVHLGDDVLVFETPVDPTIAESGDDSSLTRQVTVVDPMTGDAGLTHVGVFASIEPGPLLVIRAGGKVLGADLSAEDASFSLLGTLDVDETLFAVSGGTVLSIDASGTAVRSSRGQRVATITFEPLGDVMAPDSIVDIEPLGGFDLLISSDDAVFGASQNLPRYALRWQVPGDVLESTPSDRGSIVLVESPSADEQFVIDASTGRTITSVPDVVGRWSAFSMTANGVVVLERDGASSTRVAYDLDGNVVWELAGSGPIAVGSGVVVDIDARSDPLGVGSEPTRLIAYADAADPTTAVDCSSDGSLGDG